MKRRTTLDNDRRMPSRQQRHDGHHNGDEGQSDTYKRSLGFMDRVVDAMGDEKSQHERKRKCPQEPQATAAKTAPDSVSHADHHKKECKQEERRRYLRSAISPSGGAA
jgi:hypothetical protein